MKRKAKTTRSTADDQQFRVIYLTAQMKDAIREARIHRRLTNSAIIEAALQQLPRIVDGLKSIGIVAQEGKRSPARYGFSDESLADIKTASESCGLPGTCLLLASLRLYCGQPTKSRKPRGGKRGAK